MSSGSDEPRIVLSATARALPLADLAKSLVPDTIGRGQVSNVPPGGLCNPK